MIKRDLNVNGHTNNLRVDNGSSGDTAVPDQPSPVVESTRSKVSEQSILNSESLLEDHVIGLEHLTESQQLKKGFLDSVRTSQGSLPQKEAFATESQLNKTDSFFQDLDRFKKSFKKTFEGYNDDNRESENIREIFRFNSRHPSQHFVGVESFSSKPNSMASKLENEKRSIKSKEISSSTMSMKSLAENNKSQSTDKEARDRFFMIKKVLGRPGVKKKQAMILQMGLNGMSEMRNKYTDNITSNGENDYVQSFDTSFDNNIKEFQENFRMSTRNNKIVSGEVDREKNYYMKSDPKTQETYSFMPTENYSILQTQNIVEVLEHIEKQKARLQNHFKPHKEFPTQNGFSSLIERLEKTSKDKKQPYSNNTLLRKVNVSSYDLEIHQDFSLNRENSSNQNSICQDKSSSALGFFATRHNLSLEEYLDSQRITEEGRQATEGSNTSRQLAVETDFKELNKTFLNSNSGTKEAKKPQARWQSQPRSRKFYDSRAQNQSCMLPQPESPDSFTHKARKYTPVIRTRERNVGNRSSLGHNKSEIISVQDGEEYENYSLQDRANILKNQQQRKLSPYMVFKSEDKKYFVRPRKMNFVRNERLQKCYGEPLKLSLQEKLKKKV